MPEFKRTVEEIADIINAEGLGYAIQHYLSGSNIEDQKLSKMWDEAESLLCRIEERIESLMRKKDPDWEWD